MTSIDEVVIFSSGDENFQKRKICSCHLGINFHVYPDKTKHIAKYGRNVMVIDNNDNVLMLLPDYVIKIKIGYSRQFEYYPNILEAARALGARWF